MLPIKQGLQELSFIIGCYHESPSFPTKHSINRLAMSKRLSPEKMWITQKELIEALLGDYPSPREMWEYRTMFHIWCWYADD